MKLDKAKVMPELTKYGFVEVTKNIPTKIMDDVKYGVDFTKNEIFRIEDDFTRTYVDKEDENLNWLKGIVMDIMFPKKECDDIPCNQTFEDTQPRGEEPYTASVDIVQPTETSIAQYSGDIVRPAISAMQAKQAWNEYLDMRKVILEPSDFQKIQNKDFIKKSGWRKFATFYNLTDKIVEETRIPDNGGFIWKIKVICTAPNGRQTEGVAMCASKEKTGARIEHDVYSTAHTRAKNRAISDMIAAGEVSAEEMDI
jgi:hypothetical protein